MMKINENENEMKCNEIMKKMRVIVILLMINKIKTKKKIKNMIKSYKSNSS